MNITCQYEPSRANMNHHVPIWTITCQYEPSRANMNHHGPIPTITDQYRPSQHTTYKQSRTNTNDREPIQTTTVQYTCKYEATRTNVQRKTKRDRQTTRTASATWTDDERQSERQFLSVMIIWFSFQPIQCANSVFNPSGRTCVFFPDEQPAYLIRWRCRCELPASQMRQLFFS
jgi:hypothetical protein